MVALLRGVNVGGKGKLPMDQLREIASGCGFENVRTYVQSGNLVFTTSGQDATTAGRTLADAIAARTRIGPEVIMRTRDELADAIDANPFVGRATNPSSLHVIFLSGPASGALEGVDLGDYEPDDAAERGRELYLYLGSGLGRSKLAAALTRRTGQDGTVRNWRTVTTLLRLADDITD